MRTTFLYNVLKAAEDSVAFSFNFFHKIMPSQDFTSEDYYILTETMRRYGGHFCAKLADAICVADSSNKRKIIVAFPDIVSKYGPGSAFAKTINDQKIHA